MQDISRQRTFVSEQLAQIEREYKTQEEADAPVRQDLAVLEKRKWKDEARLDAEAIVRTLRQRLDRLQQERRTARLEHDREQLHNQIIDVLTKLTLQEEVPVMSKTQIINIGNNNTIDSPIIIAESIQESFNVINGSAAPDNIKEQLKRLAVAVSEMSKSLPPDQQENLAQDLQTLSKESVKPNPRRQWWDLSADGLAKAAKNIGAVGKPILEILAMLRPVIEKSFI